MSSRVLLNVALSRMVQRVSCSVASPSLLGLSQNLAKSLDLVSDISLVILWVYLRFIALSWSVPASLRRASMLHISSRMPLQILSLGSLPLNILKVSVWLWFRMTSLECFNVGSSFVGGLLGWLVSSSEAYFCWKWSGCLRCSLCWTDSGACFHQSPCTLHILPKLGVTWTFLFYFPKELFS